MKLTRTNRPFGLTIKFTRNIRRWSFVFSRWSEPGLKRLRQFSSCQNLGSAKLLMTFGDAPTNFRSCRFAKSNLFSCEASSSVLLRMIFESLQPGLGQRRTANDQRRCYDLSVILPRGFHPFPSRTRKLSPAGPMVLHAKVCGSVGRCRH